MEWNSLVGIAYVKALVEFRTDGKRKALFDRAGSQRIGMFLNIWKK
jgi:hypothetical protein